jgi:hypothetical protein
LPRAFLALAKFGDEAFARHRVELFQILGSADGEVCRVPVLVHLGGEALNLFKDLPGEGPLFPYLARVRAGDRATEFKSRWRQLGIVGVTLHSYRYAWAERAKTVGYAISITPPTVPPDITGKPIHDGPAVVTPGPGTTSPGHLPGLQPPGAPPKAKSFHGNVVINPSAAKMRLVQVADEIIAILAADPNADVTVSVEIQANFPGGAKDQTKRAVSENAKTLSFKNADW